MDQVSCSHWNRSGISPNAIHQIPLGLERVLGTMVATRWTGSSLERKRWVAGGRKIRVGLRVVIEGGD